MQIFVFIKWHIIENDILDVIDHIIEDLKDIEDIKKIRKLMKIYKWWYVLLEYIKFKIKY